MVNFCFKLGDGYNIIICNQSYDICIVKTECSVAVVLISIDSKLGKDSTFVTKRNSFKCFDFNL